MPSSAGPWPSGPLIGGALTSGLGWRWIFFVNVPVGVVAIAVTLTQVQESKETNHRRIDWIGFSSFSAALFMLVFALVRGNANGWGSTMISGLLIGSAVLLAVFLVAEWRQSDPMLDLNLFRRPAVIGSSLVAITLSSSIFALFLYITLYVQDDLGYGPFAAGLRFLPITMLSFFAAPIAGKLSVRIKARYLLGSGLVMVAIGLALMSHVHTSSGWTVLLPGFIVTGIGIGTVNPVLASAAISVVPPERSGMASGANNTFRQVGIATGIAGLGAVFQSQIQQKTLAGLAASSTGREVLARGGAALKGAITGGGVRQASAAIPSLPARSALAPRLSDCVRQHLRPPDDDRRGGGRHRGDRRLCARAATGLRAQLLPYGSRTGTAGNRGGPVMVLDTTGPAPATRSPGRPRDERATRAITEAALRQLAELGYARLSMESIAAEAGVARATVYRRFKDKADLITAAIAGNPGGRFPEEPSRHPRADLVEYLEAFDERFGENCVEVVGTLLGSRDERTALALHRQRVVEPRTAYVRTLLVRAQELGELAPDTDVDLAVQMLTGSVLARRVSGTSSPPHWARRAIDMIWSSPPPGTP